MILGLTWDEGSNITPYTISLNRIDPIITQAVCEQSSIGWNNIKRGLLSKKWAQAQRIHIDSTKSTSSYEWGQNLVSAVLTVSWDLWLARNEQLHGKGLTK